MLSGEDDTLKIIQIDDGFRYGDGVSNAAAAVDELLRKKGFETRIVPRQLTDGDLDSDLFKNDDILIYNMGTILDPKIKSIRCRKILFFHNITTPELIEDADGETGIFTAAGYYQLNKTAEIFDYAIALSDYSKETLINSGWETDRVFVLPVIIRYKNLDIPPDANILNKYRDSVNIVFMGRVYPNKKHEDIIESFYYFKTRYNKNAKLIFAGSISNKSYYRSLVNYAERLEISEDVVFTGHVKIDQYTAYYKAADLFLCMSEHEGFCIPLIEAMYFNIPVLAYKSTAVSGTMGNGGVIFEEKDHEKIAQKMNELIYDKAYRDKILLNQKERLDELSADKAEAAYMSVFDKIFVTGRLSGDEIIKNKGFVFREDIFSELEREIGSEIVIYGAGAAGMKLLSALKYSLPNAEIILCDKGKAGEKEAENGMDIVSPDEAVDLHTNADFIVSLQDKHIRKNVVFMLLNKGIKADNIYVYEKYMNKVL